MNINEAIMRHNFVSKVHVKSSEGILSKELKVKIMSMRIELGKIRSSFDSDLQEFIKEVKPDGYDELFNKKDRTEEESTKLSQMTDQLNLDYSEFVKTKGSEECSFNKTITEDEYEEIVGINNGDDVEINGTTIPAEDFLEVLHDLIVA